MVRIMIQKAHTWDQLDLLKNPIVLFLLVKNKRDGKKKCFPPVFCKSAFAVFMSFLRQNFRSLAHRLRINLFMLRSSVWAANLPKMIFTFFHKASSPCRTFSRKQTHKLGSCLANRTNDRLWRGALTGRLKLFQKTSRRKFLLNYSISIATPKLNCLSEVFFDDGSPLRSHWSRPDSHLPLLFLLLSLHQFPSLLPLSFFLSDFLQRLSVFEHHIVLSSRPLCSKKKKRSTGKLAWIWDFLFEYSILFLFSGWECWGCRAQAATEKAKNISACLKSYS